LAEAEIFKKETGEYPVLILDDVFSELDKTRQKILVKMASKMQTILTATHYAPAQFKDFSVNKITVENGKIKRPRTKLSANGSVKCDQKQ
jgi:DNA replication and repair protein RecF